MTHLLAAPKASTCGPRSGLECVRIQSGMHRVSATDEWRGWGQRESQKSRQGWLHTSNLRYVSGMAWINTVLDWTAINDSNSG